MKKQIVVIGGGDTFKTYKEYISFLKKIKFDFERNRTKRWKENLPESLGKDFDIISLKMPNTANARYKEWKILFNKLLPFLRDNVILLGHSLGGIFLAKYLSENKFPKRIKALLLVSAPYSEKGADYFLGDFRLPKKLNKLENQVEKIFLYQSKDDPIVPFSDVVEYGKALPEAKVSIFKDRKHFDQTKFPELVRDIKLLS
jgi:hypothetical protein